MVTHPEPNEEVRHRNDELILTLLEKISSLEAKVNVNRFEFQDMVGGVTKSPFLRRIMEVEAPSKYSALKVKEYRGDTNPYEHVCHFE